MHNADDDNNNITLLPNISKIKIKNSYTVNLAACNLEAMLTLMFMSALFHSLL